MSQRQVEGLSELRIPGPQKAEPPCTMPGSDQGRAGPSGTFHYFPLTVFFPPPRPCLGFQDFASEGLCTPLPSVQGRESAENHLFLPYAISFSGALLSPQLLLLRCSCDVFLSFFSSSSLSSRRAVPCCLPLLCPPYARQTFLMGIPIFPEDLL